MRLAIKPLLLACFMLPFAVQAKPLSVCTEASPEGFDVVQYNSLTTTNASADVLMNRLVEFDAKAGKVVPSLADSWAVSPDGLQYTFKLHPGVKFHTTPYFKPTRTLDASDVLQSFQRMLDPANPWHKVAQSGYPHAQSMQLPALIKAIDAPDPMTVRFTLNHPEATFLATLSMGFASIYSAEYQAQLLKAGTPEKLNTQPIGTGPFVFGRYQKDAVIRYKANPDYFAGKPASDPLIFAITTDPTVRLQRLKAGECQIALSPKPQDIAVAAQDSNLKTVKTPAFMTAFVALNTQHPPLDKPEVRQAINLAFDKTSYLKAVFEGTADKADGIYPPTTWSYDKSATHYAYAPDKARALLAKAGLKDGFSTTIWTRPTGSLLNPNPALGAQMLQADLAKVGIKAEIRVLEWGELIRRGKAGEHDLLFMGWSGDNGDPDNFLSPQFSCAAVQSGTNFARYCSPELDKLISQGKATTDQAKRSALYQKAQALIADQALWVPLAHPTVTVLERSGVEGYVPSPFGRQDFAPVRAD
ncbi:MULTISPECIES: ABC transporter substrate-binding protein [unclassified Pseudomonas]|uniref:ABC transporter substrate-binding protein n=1 Tax=unclassified Pseudomonas TaxID=196821 RepID=UPI000BD9F7A5|nr:MULTISPECIES: ABC transporter substrate-binding protein [unclassified Pseudomonas]PVZ15327.1 peptide/nickel transport system substrate-binding protein [Pseudomonas sp. URIL14HWK12:I12]PVZ24701.1 peptide/nickel transport system substrate-binding protein [Pseudomonas sp. URIL14HWK12:I10]PVZ34546.1 peptide/nickel transport system substrate-binding protein [Pseudomonas sp. URIL14HWK12:I11]SNZ08614.1 peptide/nickel transport system substrate-binding protein [Pseudomonas sp. URIL14HWK12:I9]